MSQTIKLISLNIWIGGILFDEIVQFLEKEKPDILLLQEVFDGKDPQLDRQHRSFEELQKLLPLKFSHFAPAFIEEIEGQDIVQGQAIFSRFPLMQVSVRDLGIPFGKRINERWAFPQSPRSLQHVIAKVNGKDLHLLNIQGVWGEDGEDNSRRDVMSHIINDEVGDHHPLILAGDFNVMPHTQAIKNIEKKLSNVFKGELTTSFNLKRKDLDRDPGFATAVVDMVFVTSDITVIKKQVPQVDISDHLPLVVEVALS